MARQVSVEPFRKFVRDIEGQILRTSQAFINRVAKQMVLDIAVMNRSFFQQFVAKSIGVQAAPDLAEFTRPWKALSTHGGNDSYSKRKERQFPGKGFFERTGALKRSLLQATGSALGKPTVEFTRIPTKVATNQSFRFEIEPAPALRNLRGIRLLEAINSGTQQRSMKLSAFRGQMTRPVLEPYLRWYVKYVVGPSVLRRLQ